MSEFIGSRISLISKSDIRYVGTLVEINSEDSTVSLENVRSFGTEGRKGGKDEYAPSNVVYETIVFRGSDVKDLRIEEPAKESKPAPPPMPDDPAIIGVHQQQPRAEAPQNQQRPQQPPNFPPPGQFPPGYPPYGGAFQHQRFGPGPQPPFPGPGGPGGFPGPYGMPGPYGAPPGWYPPGPGQGFNQPFSQPPNAFLPPMPIGPPGQQNQNQQPRTTASPGATAPIGPPGDKDKKPKIVEAEGSSKPAEVKPIAKPQTQATPPAPAAAATTQPAPPPPPVESKPDVAAALAPPTGQSAPAGPLKNAPVGPKSGRIVPAIPLASPGVAKATASRAAQPQPATAAPTQPLPAAADAAAQLQNSTQAATAAVAAAMAKLEIAAGRAQQPQATTPLDNLTKKVNEMRADSEIRHGRQPGTGGYAAGHRGADRGGRGGRGAHHQHTKIEVPATDFDFESANAKFNKQDLVKEAIASGSPMGEDGPSSAADVPANGHTNGAAENDVVIPPAAVYNKSTSFFDNLSSDQKDRTEKAPHGQQFRTEERRKNMETFGQGSVDGYRGGYRGRGRGRGFGRGRGGQGYRGRGVARGGRGGTPPTQAQPANET